jgi:hypothetical protein
VRLGRETDDGKGAKSEPGEPVVEAGAGRHDDEGNVGRFWVGFEQPARGAPIEMRGRDVEQDQRGCHRARPLDDLLARLDGNRHVAGAFEAGQHECPAVGRLLGDEDRCTSCRGGGGVVCAR